TVCFDKTGTLTEGRMKVHEVTLLGDEEPDQGLAALAVSDPNPNATLAAIGEAFPRDPRWEVLSSVPFSSARKWSGATFLGHGTWVLGAPEVIAPDHPDVSRIAD